LRKQTPKLWSVAVERLTALLAGFGIGFLVGFLVRRHLVFKNEVEVGDLVNLFSAFVLAFILQNAIQKRVSNIRAEKDLLIARVTATNQALNAVHDLFLRRVADLASIPDGAMLAVFKDLSNQLWILEKALAKSKAHSSIDLKNIKNARLAYRKRILGDDFSPGPYSQTTINSEDRNYRRVALELVSITFEINYR
jgi:hypothetical protein